MNLNPRELPQPVRYKLSIGAVLPRPIAWVSSMNRAGQLNVAPYSYFTVASTDPLVLLFCPQAPMAGQQKDTLRNIQEMSEFVINITNEETAEAMSQTAATLPPGVSEFEYAGLTPAPSQTIRVPRVAEAPIAFECTLHHIVTINGATAGGGSVVMGTVQNIYLRDDVYDAERQYILLDKLQPIGRLAGNQYVHVTDVFDIVRG